MNKKYFIAEEDEQKGPFSFNELKEIGVSKTTLIWEEGFEDWTEAGKIEKIQSLLKITPPKLPKIKVKKNKKVKKDKTLNVNLAIGKPKTKLQLKEKDLANEKLKTSIAKNSIYYTKRILTTIIIFGVSLIIYIQVKSSIPKYSEPGVMSEDYEQFLEKSDYVFFFIFFICFFIIFGKPLSQTFGWFKKHSEKEF